MDLARRWVPAVLDDDVAEQHRLALELVGMVDPFLDEVTRLRAEIVVGGDFQARAVTELLELLLPDVAGLEIAVRAAGGGR